MYYSKYIKPIVFALSILMGILMCAFTTVMAEEHAETAEAAEVADETEASEEASEEASQSAAPVRLESLVVCGNRVPNRAPSWIRQSVPIDIVSHESFKKQGGADLPDLLRTLVPSYNINTQPISDASTVVRPANLRGLAPDHTLVLVNNKRPTPCCSDSLAR